MNVREYALHEVGEKPQRPIRIVQFGEGNFLRCFVDSMVEELNASGQFCGDIAIVKPIPYGNLDAFTEQDCDFTVLLQGRDGERAVEESRIIRCVRQAVDAYGEYEAYRALALLPELRFVVSNTTEAGIVYDPSDRLEACPPTSFPGKITKFLYERYRQFRGAPDKGLIFLPVELIDRNGERLLDCVRRLAQDWKLEAAFLDWVKESCSFCCTLVDRIVTGFPKRDPTPIYEKLGYEDRLLTIGEPFALWVIESSRPEAVRKELPLDRAGLPVCFTRDLRPYRERKVRILNGAHTALCPAAFLAGEDIVRNCMEDRTIRRYLERAVYEELAPSVPLPKEEVLAFAKSVFTRFDNPFLDHSLLSICLNSVSKWRTRDLPSLKDRFAATGELPPCLTFSFAALLAFYTSELRDGKLIGWRGEEEYPILDDEPVLAFFAQNSRCPDVHAFVERACAQESFWGEDLNQIPGFTAQVTRLLSEIRQTGSKACMERLGKGEHL